MKKLLAIFIAVSVGSGFAANDPTFNKANADFAAGKFQDAINGYEQVVASRNLSANLFYNLGNAFYRAGDTGKAILNYERALALEPHHPETEANLRLAREQSRALELRQRTFDRYIGVATAKQYTVVSAIAFWIVAFGIASVIFARRKSLLRGMLVVLATLIFVAAATAACLLEAGPRGANIGIVTGKAVEARLATADSAGSVLALPPGSEVKILSTRGDWLYAFLPNESRGWIRANAVEAVRL